ncbi:ATP-binding protein [Sphingobacterium litopenaei]|nr:ATP-binding protein [Sphingobacterium litopenaei]
MLKDWKQNKFFKKGYRTLFYGPSGTGKTMTASLIGKELSKILNADIPVYRVDLSQIVSKYVGETEKNLAKLFAKAEQKKWILFFDEGENFFSNRTNIKDSNDKYANQEVSYLLQRIEDYDGLVIVATNLKSNIDDAFARRFQSMIEFKLPNEQEREALWSNILPDERIILRETQLIPNLLKYNLSGGNIVNVVQYACLKAAKENQPIITLENCLTGIRRELAKMGKTL